MADHKNKKQNETVDAGLCGNEKIEEAIAALQQEPTQEMLAHTLTVIRRRMQENGQFIVAVEPPTGDGQIRVQAIKTADGKAWWAAFTRRRKRKIHLPGKYRQIVCIRSDRTGNRRSHHQSMEPDDPAG